MNPEDLGLATVLSSLTCIYIGPICSTTILMMFHPNTSDNNIVTFVQVQRQPRETMIMMTKVQQYKSVKVEQKTKSSKDHDQNSSLRMTRTESKRKVKNYKSFCSDCMLKMDAPKCLANI